MEKKLVRNDDALYLSREVINNILKRLPVKSLIRFQCVCKEWKNLFKTRSFIEEHLRHSAQQNDFLLCKRSSHDQNPILHLCFVNRDMQVIKYEKIPFYVRNRSIVGSSNGLICLGSWYFILWNPATREVFRVPKAKIRCTVTCLVGFGFSPIVNDYKIVRISLSEIIDDDDDDDDYYFDGGDDDDDDDCDQVSVGQVFSLRTNSWQEVEAGKLKDITFCESYNGFTFDGEIFWFGYKLDKKMEREKYLISFDIATELLKLIPVPSHVSGFDRLTVFDNKLAMLCRSGGMYISGMEGTTTISMKLWVIEKCGDALVWTNIYTSTPYTYRECKILAVWRNQVIWKRRAASSLFIGYGMGKVYIIEDRLVLSNLHTDESKLFESVNYPIGSEVWNYVESLVSPGNFQMEASSS